MKIRRDDTVEVIAGKDKGKRGKVRQGMPAEEKVIVADLNIAKKHVKKGDPKRRAGIIEVEMPLARVQRDAGVLQVQCNHQDRLPVPGGWIQGPLLQEVQRGHLRAGTGKAVVVGNEGDRMPTLRDKYEREAIPALKDEFNYTNIDAGAQGGQGRCEHRPRRGHQQRQGPGCSGQGHRRHHGAAPGGDQGQEVHRGFPAAGQAWPSAPWLPFGGTGCGSSWTG